MSHINRRNVLKLVGATATLGMLRPSWAEHAGDDDTPRRTFVLIHGAWHTGAAWDEVASRLRLAGHKVKAPTLPGKHPVDRGEIQFDDYVDAVVAVVQQQHHKVILVGHSSAGMLLQAAAPRVADMLDMVVFNNAFIMANGESQLDNIPAAVADFLTAVAQSTPDNTIPVAAVADFIRNALMEGDPVEKQDALIASLVAQPFALLSTPVDTEPFEALHIPKAVLFCLRDHSADYLGMATRLGSYSTITANGSHEMLFSAPVGYTKALLKLVALTHCAS
jgi:pimeloyl-ACP methyl ester carboxylesterase